MTPSPPSNLPSLRRHMARMRREFTLGPMTHRPASYCKGCEHRLYSFKSQGWQCINALCEFYMRGQATTKPDALDFTHCVGCGRKLEPFKSHPDSNWCNNQDCKHYRKLQ